MENWLRWHVGTVTDPKFRAVAKRSGQPVAIVLAVWAMMLERANDAAPRGTIEGWCHEDAAAGLDLEPEQVEAVYRAMQGKVLDGDVVTGWWKRQPKREDASTERVRAYRERKRAETRQDQSVAPEGGTHETPAPVDETQCNAVKRAETLEERRGEKSYVSSSLSEEDTKAGAPERGSRLPAGFVVPDEWRAAAVETRARHNLPPVDVDLEADKFVAYWLSKSGKDGRKADWRLTWLNWSRNARPTYARPHHDRRNPSSARRQQIPDDYRAEMLAGLGIATH